MKPTPVRLQLSRKRGFNLQKLSRDTNGLEAVNCARPSKWGNPFVVQFDPHTDYSPQTASQAVKMFKQMLALGKDAGDYRERAVLELSGKNLACWCKKNAICHCDFLLTLSNKPISAVAWQQPGE